MFSSWLASRGRLLAVSRYYLAISILLLEAGCQGTQLRTTVVDVSSIIESIEADQTINNFGRTAFDQGILPSQVLLTTGTMQIVNTVTPSVTFPLSGMFARTVSATPSTVSTTAGASSTLSGSISWQENLIIQAMTDPLVLRNLRILYNVALDVEANRNQLNQYQVPRAYDRSDQLVPDPYFLQNEDCVFCLNPAIGSPSSDAELRKMVSIALNDVTRDKMAGSDAITINDALTYQWIFWRRDDEPSDVRHPLTATAGVNHKIGHNSGYTLYLADQAFSPIYPKLPSRPGSSLFSEFILLTLPLQNVPTRFSSVSAPTAKRDIEKKKKLGPAPAQGGPINNGSNYFRPFFNVPFPAPGIQPNPQ